MILYDVTYFLEVVNAMDRNAFVKLIQWKNDPDRKPLVIKGARQVGKTWLMEEFGKKQYESYVSFNFDEEEEFKSILNFRTSQIVLAP